MRVFAVNEDTAMREWEPEAIVLPLALALAIGGEKQRGVFTLPSLNTAIVVLTSIEDSPLGDGHRDKLWNAFGVPIFEQLRGADGAVVARECEVHDGLHLVGSATRPEGQLIREHCACGSEAPRLRRLTATRGSLVAA